MAVTDDIGDNASGPPAGSAPTRRATRIAKLRAKAFRAAGRHTLYVKSLRVLLPVGIVAILGAYGAYLYARTGVKIAGGIGKFEGVQITADDLKMTGVKYSGSGKDGSRYDVRARDAAVDFAQTGPVKLNFIDGDLVQPNGVVTKLKSRAGLVDNKKGEIDLLDGVDVVSSNGLAAKARTARIHQKQGEIDLKDGVAITSTNGLRANMKSAKVYQKDSRVVANEGVTADMPTGRISADRMDLETKTKTGTFQGNVAVRLTQDQTTASKPVLGLGKETRAPVDVKAPRLDIDDTKRFAVFTGGVTASQGESTLKSADMRITYDGRPPPSGASATRVPVSPSATDLLPDTSGTKPQKLTASGGVTITSGGDRSVRADSVEFDVPADLATFIGASVEIQQGKNRMLGRRLVVDRKSGKTALDAPAEGRTPVGRIQTTFYQAQDGKPKAVKAAAPVETGGVMSFKTDPTAPMDVAAERLDVNDAAKQAVYRGAVRAQQGDFVMETAELVATYTGETGLMAANEGAAKGAPAQMSKVEAKSKVHITSREGQSLRGEWAIFDVKANTVVVGGPVLVKQGPNELTGPQMRIDMTTGEARFDDDKAKPRIGPAIAPSTPATAAKSAPGPGGLPGVGGGTTPVVQPGCQPGGRACLTFYPETAKDLKKQDATKTAVPKSAAAPKAAIPAPAPTKPKTDGWAPSGTASPTYRAPAP